jgi:signal transduction histidine kinase/ligand-binding sensor domain-containing protein/DNA-binding response OmpR family regulator
LINFTHGQDDKKGVKMQFNKSLFLILFYIGFSVNAQAVNVEKIGVERGLSNNNVVSIAQDNDGFIWICTKDGLNRFDANTFRVFKTSGSDSNSICSNFLNFVYADKFDDVVWVASEKNGVDAYNYKTHTFTHYEHDYSNPDKNDLSANGVTYIDGDEDGNLWFATYDAGIDFLDRKTGRFTNYNQSNTPGLGSNYNWCVMHDTEERIYAGHVNDGFSIINLETKTAVNFKHDPNNPASLPDNTVTSIFKDSRENIWIGTRNGLALFDQETYHMIIFKSEPGNPSSLSHNFIQTIIETDDHKLWIGTEGGGVNILDLKDLAFNADAAKIQFEHIMESEAPDGLSSLSVQAILQDSFGNIWIGGLGGGINFISNRESMFKRIVYLPYIGYNNSLNYKVVPGLCADGKNNVWAANGFGGIAIYHEGEKINQLNNLTNDTRPQNFISIYKDSKNNIWTGTDKGSIYKYNGKFNSYTTIDCFDDLDNIPVYCFFEDSKNNLWIATDIGLHVYNIISGECTVYTTDNSELPDNIIRTVAEDGNGNIWVGTLIGGLYVFDENFNLIKNYWQTYDFYAVNHIYKDSQNRMWIGSQNDLFLIKNQLTDSVMRIGEISGLAETNIRAIIEGRSANEIWLSTTNGISYIDLNTMHVSNFDVSDGIAMGDYLNGAVTKTMDGQIYFGSQNGITWFNQAHEQAITQAPKANFTGFSVANKKNYLNEFTDIPFNDEIELKYNQNSFQISFNVLDYSLADKVEFIYQMKGLDDDWYLADNNNEVAFRNLKPGNYVFSVQSRIQNKEWPSEYNSLTISIKPPLWLTWWMKVIYIAAIVFIILYILEFYKNKLKIENDLLLEKKSRQKEHELHEEKLRFFTNVTHELRSPMTLILGPLEDLISEKSLKPDQTKKLQLIQRVANRLLQSINQILEFRKSENKNRKLSVISDDVAKYIYEIGTKYNDLNQNKAIDFQITVPDQKVEMFFDPDVLTIIVDNLLSNAFKYTKEGRITLELTHREEDNVDYTEIIISDTGYGISEKDIPHIFDRYYQAKNASHPLKGTGIGLALVKNMVDLHEAEIEVSSRMNEGTVFKVKFLTNNSYPDAVHYFPEEIQIEETEENLKNVILIVDDDHEIVEYIKDSLSDSYTVISAENGKVGLKTATEEIPHIIICDIMMPIMDGIEMCRLLKKDIRTSHIPVVLLTAKGSLHDQKTGYDAGADSYLTKPFSSNLLKSRLKNIFDARKKHSLTNSSKFKQKQQLLNESIGELDKEFLKKLTAVIEENLEDEELNISYVAAQLNMSHSTLYRKIKALTNLTANEFIRKVRVNYAEQLLITGQYNISEIMYRIGINSSSYFRQCFKEEFGMNPSEYLQKLKENHGI